MRDIFTLEEKKIACNEMMTKESHMEQLILKYFEAEDFKALQKRKIGNGLIGGKACGLLVARKILSVEALECMPYIEPHDSYFIASNVFRDYLEQNDCAKLWESQPKERFKEEETEELQQKLRNGQFSSEVEGQFKAMLEHYGNTPIIVRSSSLLEDGYANMFSGKYESIFCPNQGSLEDRLEMLKEAIRKVYSSMVNPSAIEYRKRRKLLEVEEQMALLVQKVEGQILGDIYMPMAAGMGCSYNPYKWMDQMNPNAGMLRLVMGLGTRAVERTPGDYPRLIGLDRASANFYTTIADRHKFSQRFVDVLDLEKGEIRTVSRRQVMDRLPAWQKKMVLSHDTDAEFMLAQRQDYRNVYFVDCQGLVNNKKFIQTMSQVLKVLEKAYELPVDIEFALKSEEPGNLKINLLQCRPLKPAATVGLKIPEMEKEKIFFDLRKASARSSKKEKIDTIVWVDPHQYYECPYVKKSDVKGIISKINQVMGEGEKNPMLLVPGRIGTTSPELGVPVVYADISQFKAICEIAYSKAGHSPDLSYGSHMFQDFVEADVFYGAIHENSNTRVFQPNLLEKYPEIFLEICPEETEFAKIVKVYDVKDFETELYLDARKGRAVCMFQK